MYLNCVLCFHTHKIIITFPQKKEEKNKFLLKNSHFLQLFFSMMFQNTLCFCIFCHFRQPCKSVVPCSIMGRWKQNFEQDKSIKSLLSSLKCKLYTCIQLTCIQLTCIISINTCIYMLDCMVVGFITTYTISAHHH